MRFRAGTRSALYFAMHTRVGQLVMAFSRKRLDIIAATMCLIGALICIAGRVAANERDASAAEPPPPMTAEQQALQSAPVPPVATLDRDFTPSVPPPPPTTSAKAVTPPSPRRPIPKRSKK